MPRSKDENEKIRAETQSKIMDTAISVFASKGFSDTSISDIAKAANISVGLMYRYFNSKQDLFNKIVDYAIMGLNEMTNMAISSTTPKETLEMICDSMIESLNHKVYLDLNLMIIQGLFSKNVGAYEKILLADDNMIKAFDTLIQNGQKQGVFTDGDSLTKAHLFLSTIQGIILMKAFYKEKHQQPSTKDVITFIIRS